MKQQIQKASGLIGRCLLAGVIAVSGCGVHYSDGGYSDFNGKYYPPESAKAKQEKKASDERMNSLFRGLGTSIIMQETYGNKN